MSKTFRYSQDGECGCSRERRARRGDSRHCDQADGSGAGANVSSRSGESFVMSLEAAIGRMMRHMEFEAGKLVADGIVPASEKEDAQSVMRSAAIRAYPMYDASRLNEQGTTATHRVDEVRLALPSCHQYHAGGKNLIQWSLH